MEEKVNILLVDDQKANLDALEAILDNPDYHFVRAMSGREALKHLLEFRDFAVILLDVQMPEMDGFEMARLIKKRKSSRSIPIIFLTAISKEESYVFEGYAAGAVDYLIKPFDAAILKSKVAVFVELFRKDRELQELNEALRAALQSEMKHRTVADFTYNWEYWISPEGKFLYISPSFKRITGYEGDMLILDKAQDLAGIVHPEDRPAFQTHLEAEIMDSPVIHHFEFRISRPEGGVRWINHSCQPIYDTEGHFLGRRASNEDITDRKQAEESLRESEENYRNLFENANEAIFVAQDGKVVILNPMAAVMIGYTNEELLAMPFIEFIHPDDRDMVIDRHVRRMKGEEFPHLYPFRIIHRDGNVRWVELNAVLINWKGKAATLNFLSDITQRKQAEEMLHRTEENFRRSLDDSPLGVRIVTIKGETIYANQAILDIYDFDSIEELKTTPVEKRYTPESYAEFRIRREKRKRGDDGPSEYDISIVRKDGEIRDLQVFRKDILWDGERQFQVIYQDITERKRTREALRASETHYRLLAENATDVIWTVGMDMRLTYVSPSVTMLLGFTAEEAMARTMQQAYTPAAFEKAMQIFAEEMAIESAGHGDPTRSRMLELELVRKDGNTVLAEGNFCALRDPIGKMIGILAILRDITERKRTEKALEESEKRYRELSIVDDLTQLYNSRYFYHQLKMEMDRADRYGQPLTLLLLDLDNFKVFNDAYGHVEGDQVLWRLGHVVKRCLRQTDSAYRYGGEEFVILLPMTTGRDGAVTAERIRTEFKKENFSPAPGQDVHVTVSIGLAQYQPQEEMKAFVHRVDQLMYQGKKNGKDRVCSESYEESGPLSSERR